MLSAQWKGLPSLRADLGFRKRMCIADLTARSFTPAPQGGYCHQIRIFVEIGLLEKDLVLGPLVSESKYNFRTSVRILGQLSKNRSSIEEPPVFLAGAGDGIRIHDSLLGNYQGDFLELRRSKIPIPKP